MFVINKLRKTEDRKAEEFRPGYFNLHKLKNLNLKHIAVSLITLAFSFLFLGTTKAATFSFNPAAQVFERGCVRTLTILVNANGESSNAGEVEISYDPAQITIIDSQPGVLGVQIESGNAYEAYVYNQVNTSTGIIKVAGVSFIQNLNSQQIFARINFVSTPSASIANFNIRFDGVGQTFDSNIADSSTNLDLLTGVTNGTYTFVNGVCNADTQGPNITFISPTNNQVGVPLNSNITIRLTDNQSGVDLNTVEFIVNGVLYRPTDPQVTYTGNALDYTFTINPTSDFPSNQASTVVVRASDNSGNSSNRQIIFNIPSSPALPGDRTPPTVVFINPVNQQVSVKNGDEMEINLLDDESGIDINSVRVYLNGDVISNSDIAFTGDINDYILTFIATSIIENKVNYLRITGRDLEGNEFDRQILFNESVPEPLSCPVTPPTDGINSCTNPPALETTLDRLLEGTIFKDVPVENLATGISLLAFLLSLVPFLNLLSLGGLALRAIGFLLGKRNDYPWGLVIDSYTGKPIPFAICELYVEGAQYKLTQTVSDLEGRYGFIVPVGDYRLEIKQSGYVHYKKSIQILGGDQSIVNDAHLVPIDKIDQDSKLGLQLNLFSRFKNYLLKISNYLFITGFVLSIIALLIVQSLINIIVVILYFVILGIILLAKLLRLKRKYAQVLNTDNKLRIPFAQVKIFDPKTWKLVDSQITNYNGLFDFYGEPGEYAILVAARGYKFPSKENKYAQVEGKFGGLLNVQLSKGKNNISLFMDSEATGNTVYEQGTSPFGGSLGSDHS